MPMNIGLVWGWTCPRIPSGQVVGRWGGVLGQARGKADKHDAVRSSGVSFAGQHLCICYHDPHHGCAIAMGALLKPSERFRSEVDPAFKEYLSDSLSERRANNIARALDHHLDWTYEYYARGDRSRLPGDGSLATFRQNAFASCPVVLQMMHDLSDASHHRILTRPSKPSRIVVVSSAAYAVQDCGELWVNGYETPFLPAARTAVEFWKHWPD
jgi:hypothetical protein